MCVVKQQMKVPQVQHPGVGEQRLAYVEGLIDDATVQITAGVLWMHASMLKAFFQRVLNLEDMHVGAYVRERGHIAS